MFRDAGDLNTITTLLVAACSEPRRYELGDGHGSLFGALLDPDRTPVQAVASHASWHLTIERSRRGWLGVARIAESQETIARYEPTWRAGGRLRVCGETYQLRPKPGNAWCLIDPARTTLVRMGPPGEEPDVTDSAWRGAQIVAALELTPTAIAGPQLTMLALLGIWLTALEMEALQRARTVVQGF